MDNLPLQIGQINLVIVHQGESAHAGSGQIHGHGRAQPAQAHNQYMGFEKCLLGFCAETRQQYLAAVAQQLLVIHRAILAGLRGSLISVMKQWCGAGAARGTGR